MTTRRMASRGSAIGLARRKRILAAAAEVFSAKGFSNATVRDIADAADILSGSLYYYFDSKEAIVEALLIGYSEGMVSKYEQILQEYDDPVQALEQFIAAALRSVADQREHITILQNDWNNVIELDGLAPLMDRIEELWLQVIDKATQAGNLRNDLDPRMIFRTLMGAIQAVPRWFDPKGADPIDNVIKAQSMIFMEGLRA